MILESKQKSKILWWAVFFFGHLTFWLIYILRGTGHDAPTMGWEWVLLIMGVALVVTLPLLLYRYSWLIAALIFVFALGLSLFISQGYILYALLSRGLAGLLLIYILLGFLLPIILQKRFFIGGKKVYLTYVVLAFEIVISGVSIATISYASLLVQKISPSNHMLVDQTQLNSQQLLACKKLEQLTVWATSWRGVYRKGCPVLEVLPGNQTGREQPYLAISDSDLERAINDCQVARVFVPEAGFKGVCMRNGSKYVTQSTIVFPDEHTLTDYSTTGGKTCRFPQFNGGETELDVFKTMEEWCKSDGFFETQ